MKFLFVLFLCFELLIARIDELANEIQSGLRDPEKRDSYGTFFVLVFLIAETEVLQCYILLLGMIAGHKNLFFPKELV